MVVEAIPVTVTSSPTLSVAKLIDVKSAIPEQDR